MCLVKKGVHSNMNKIFKVVWSKTKECYVVVSEVAKNNGGKKKALASVLAGLAMVAATAGTPVQAGVGLGGSSVNITPDGTLNGSNTVSKNSVVVGYQNNTTGGSGNGHIVYGANNVANQDSSMALGNQNVATGPAASAIGVGSQATGRNTIAVGNVAKASNTDNIAIGTYSEALTSGQDAYALAVGSYSKANAHMAVGIGAIAKATGSESTAVGAGSTASGANSTALGARNTASGLRSVAIGKDNNATAEDTIAMGKSNTAAVGGAVAIGMDNVANSTLNGGRAEGNSMVAIGKANKATKEDTVAVGRENTASGNVSVAIGARTEATNSGSIAIAGNGDGYKTTSTGLGSIAIGMQSNSTGTASTAVGGVAQATAKGASALGFKANATAESATALGQESVASVKDGVALGSQSKATVDKGVKGFNPATGRTNKYSDQAGAVGTSTLAAVSVGDGANATRQITGLAAGTEDTDAVNVAQLKNVNLKFAGNSGNGDVLLKDGTLNVKGEGLISTSADNDGIKVKLTQGGPITADNTGKAKEPTNNGVATTQNVVQAINNSGWNATAGSEDGGTHTGNPVSAIVKPGNTVAFVAGKNLNVEQRVGNASTGGDQEYIYSLNKDVDLTKDGSLTIGDTKIVNDGLTITGGPSITKTGINAGNKTITNVSNGVNDTDAVNVSQLKAVAAKERHIKPDTYAVDGNGNVTMTYVDGDGNDITGDKAIITGVAKQDLSNINNAGKNVITGLGTIVKAGDNVNVSESSDATTGQKTYTVNAVTPAVYTKADGTKVVKRPNGTFTTNLDGSAGNDVDGADVIASFMDGNGNTTGGNMVINNVGSAIDKTGTSTGDAFLTKLNTAATNTPNAAVNVKDLKTTSDALVDKGLKFTGNNTGTENAHKLGSLVKVQGEGLAATDVPTFASAAGNIAVVANGTDTLELKLNKNLKGINSVNNGNTSILLNDAPNATTPAVTIKGGNLSLGDGTTNNKIVNLAPGTDDNDAVNVKQLKAAKTVVEAGSNVTVTKNTGSNGEDVYTVSATGGGTTTASSWNVKSTGNTDSTSEPAAKTISNGNTVEMAAGKNLTVKQTSDANGAKVEFALNKDLSNLDKVVVNGKDGIAGKDGVTIVGPQGATGAPGIPGTNGIDGKVGISGKDGKDAVSIAGKDGVGTIGLTGPQGPAGTNGKSVDISTENGKQTLVKPEANNGNQSQRIVYVPKDKDGNPLKDGDGNTIKREVATMDDGLKFAGDDGQTNANKVIAKQLNQQVDIIGGATGTLTDNNIGVNNDGGKLKVQLAKTIDLTKDGSVTTGNTKVDNSGVTITAPTGGTTTNVSLTQSGLNNGGNKIVNVKEGTADTDAVNVKQLKANRTEVKAGDNVVVTSDVDATDNHTVYTVNAVTPAVYTTPDGEKLTKDKDGKFHKVGEAAEYTGDIITSFENPKAAAGQTTKDGGMIVNNVGSAIKTQTGATYLDKLKAAADAGSNVKNAAVNVSDLHNTAEALKANELHIAPTAVKAGSTEVKGGVASGTENVYKYDAATKKVTLTYNDGNGKAVTDTKAVIDFSALNTGGTTASTWTAKTSAENTTAGSEVGKHIGDTSQVIDNQNSVDFQAGRNMTVKQTNDGNGNTTINYALDKDLTNLDKVVVNGKDGIAGKDGVTIVGPQGATGAPGIPGTNGIDGKVGISGKDGKDAVSIAGKDGVGTIGLTGPQGPAGTNGKSVDISTENGKQTLVKPEANNGNQSQRIVYVPKDKDGNPLKDGDGNTIKREVATMDDGLKFAGDDGQTNANKVIAKQLNQQVDIIGGATGTLTDNNIGVNNDGGKLKVQLAKTIDLTKDGSVTTGNTKVDNSGVTITAPTGGTTTNVSLTQSGLNNGGNKIVNVKEGTADTDAVNVKQLKDAKTVLVDGKNTKKEGTGTAADPYKVNVEGALVDISSITNGSGSGKLSFGPNQTVTVDGDHSITLNAKTGKIGGLQNKTFDPNNFTSGQAATEDQLKSVHDTLKASELHIAPTTGTTEDKGGTASGSTNVYKYDATNKTVTLTYNDGNGQAVNGPKAVIDFSALNVTSGNNYGFSTNAGGNLATGTTASVKPVASGKTVTYAAGKNLTVAQKETNGDLTYTYALDKDLTNLDKIVVNGKDGQPGHDGVTITGPQGTAGVDGNNGKVGISGKDGKDAVSISGKDGVGHIGLTGPAGKDGKDATADITVKDGVPGVDGAPGDSMTRIVYKDKDGKDHEVATHDDGMKFAGDNGQTNQDTNPNVIKKHLNNVVDIIGGATGTLTDNNIGVNADNGKLKVQLAKDINLTKDGSLTIGGTKVDGNGLTITGGPSVTKTGIDAGNKAITNVANGTNDSDAVNVSQLKGSITTVKSSDSSITVTDANAGSTDPTKGHAYDIKVNNQGVVNNAQLPVEYTKVDGTKVYKQPNGSFNTAKDGSGDVVNAGDVIASMNNGSDSTTAPMKLANVGSSIAGQSGSTYLDKINAAASNPNTTNNAVNVSDLKDTAKAIGDKGLNFGAQSGTDIHKNLGEKLEIVGGGQKADSEYDASNIKTMTKDGKVVVALDKNIKADTVTVGKDGKDGVDGKIGVNGKDGASVTINGKDGSIGLQGPKGADGKDGASATIKVKDGVPGVDGKDGETLTRIVYETKDGVEHQVATHDDGLKFTGNNTSTVNKHHLNSLVKVQGEGVTEAQSTSFQSAAGNINVKANGTDTLEVQLNKDLKGINSIRNSATGPAMTFNTGDIAISGGNLNMGDNKITNVGPGTDGTDAVNLNQLKAARTVVTSKDGSVTVTPNENQATHEMTYDLKVNGAHDPRVDQLNEEIGRVGAQGAALAALKPIQYDPLEPTQIMAGYGNYRGNSALAVGVAHYKNESTMLHAGMSWAGGSSHMMANAGVTWKFGNRDAENAIADRYRKGPISAAYALQNEMAAVKAQNAGLKSEVSDLKAENQQMKAQIAAMMAKLGL